jgi:hypothetical protein
MKAWLIGLALAAGLGLAFGGPPGPAGRPAPATPVGGAPVVAAVGEQPCPSCAGLGYRLEVCPICRGTGHLNLRPYGGLDNPNTSAPCPMCHGQRVLRDPCLRCGGTGRIRG